MSEGTLYHQLAEAVGEGESKYIPAIFESLIDENEARVLLSAAPPATIKEISEKTGIEEAEIEKMIDPLFDKGLIYKSKKPDGITSTPTQGLKIQNFSPWRYSSRKSAAELSCLFMS